MDGVKQIMRKLPILKICIVISLVALYMQMGCKSNSPVIVYEIPRVNIELTDDILTFMQKSTTWAVNINAWIDEIINQILFKVPHIDLRKNK